ncbi:TspO/MBR family protein [uncultured Oscillibacter sp.]|uniref:TspO/MBR family protein n=1 Tax=uncultured Oscillibacter sp. TaxID=876091 RepID=UPI0025F844AD|nr:TspO/MBR family protein [uncultured Oscillibacter sp.]
MRKHRWKIYAVWILLTEAIGALSGWLTRKGAKTYSQSIVQPPLSPPPIAFPIVWGILFALMGAGAARIYLASPSDARSQGLRIFFLQLGFNFFWSIIFFNLQRFGLALIWLLVLWGLIIWMIAVFHRTDRLAAWMQIPYLLWVSFAAYLNFGVWRLN